MSLIDGDRLVIPAPPATLDLVPTADLVKALFARYDAGVIGLCRFNKDYEQCVWKFTGSPMMASYCASRLNHKIHNLCDTAEAPDGSE